MSEPQTNQQPSSGMTFDAQPVQQDTPVSAPVDSGMTFDSAPVQTDTTVGQDGKPKFAPYNAAAFGRFTSPENYEKWASVHPKIGPDSKPGEYEAWTSANTPGGYKETLKNAAETTGYAGLAFGTAMGVTEIPALADLAIQHLAGNVLPGMEREAAKQVLVRALPHVIQFAKTMRDVGIGAGGIGLLLKTLMPK